jgi:hypothetical protein
MKSCFNCRIKELSEDEDCPIFGQTPYEKGKEPADFNCIYWLDEDNKYPISIDEHMRFCEEEFLDILEAESEIND